MPGFTVQQSISCTVARIGHLRPKEVAVINRGTSVGLIPANVSLRALATVIAGFANDVDAVNQYAAVM